ncbi:hypothetical protein [Corallococcus exercitus]|uniref:Uncharacterized protein n=1 Tax=Corallococcus exercitus TaxID=2316736 RepID=A0A7Y4KK95_9BACT|nr:hypothetical protein [Corallococcus exercitus]NOK34469.1 hypothetical protein [Corallococcus exercitus]
MCAATGRDVPREAEEHPAGACTQVFLGAQDVTALRASITDPVEQAFCDVAFSAVMIR